MSDDTNQLKLVLVTDVRFWHRQTGAQRRIESLVRFLLDQEVQVTVLFAGALDNPQSPISLPRERELIQQQQLSVKSLLEDWQPRGWTARGIWQARCLENWLMQRCRNYLPTRLIDRGRPAELAKETGKCLADFESPLLYKRFHEMLESLQPQAVIVEYVTLGYLVPRQRRHKHPRYLLDTHDFLSERNRQFQQFGYDHWLQISRAEEIEVQSRFDTVIAIQDDERQRFQELLPDDLQVIVAGHPAETQQPISSQETLTAEFTFGYFGSDNPSNLQAIQWFFDEVWPRVLAARPATTLLMAGSICRTFGDQPRTGVRQIPQIGNLRQLYRSFQIAINPVQFGTGLKIKNQEALAFGKPLVVTQQGFVGMIPPASGDAPIHVVANATEMVETLVQLSADPVAIAFSAEAAAEYSRRHLSPQTIYQSLMNCLREMQ